MKKNWITVAAVIVVAIIAVWWFQQGGSGQYAWPGASASPSVSAAPARSVVVKPKPVASATPAMSYSQLVQQYGTNRIQIDQNCQIQPESVVFKTGTSILLDNRTNQSKQITMDGKTYNLGSYGYQVVTLSGTPHNIGITCNNLPNAGTIQLEANISGQ